VLQAIAPRHRLRNALLSAAAAAVLAVIYLTSRKEPPLAPVCLAVLPFAIEGEAVETAPTIALD